MIKAIGLLSPVFVPLIISGILFFSLERNNKPKRFLVGYMLLITFVFFANLFYFNHNYAVYCYFHSLHIATVLAIYPGIYIYVKMLVDPVIRLKKLMLHLIPSLFFLLASGLIFFPFLSYDQRLYFLAEYRFKPDFSDTWLKILYWVRMANIGLLFIQVFLYSILVYITLRKYNQHIRNLFSNPERYQLNWLKLFNLAMALSAFIAVFIYSVNPVKLFGDDRYLSYPLLLIAIILWFLGVMGNNQVYLASKEVFLGSDSSEEPRIINETFDKLNTELQTFFLSKKPYLNPELKIWDVCKEIGTNRSYLSRLINTTYQQNFSSFVNTFRIQHVKENMKTNPDKPLKLLADEAGFGSVTSLARSFQEVNHQSIAAYRVDLKRSKQAV